MSQYITIGWLLLSFLGFFLLNEGAKLIADNASAVARRSRYSRFVIGMVLVSTLAALPEILVSILAAYNGSPSMAVGNILGSNIVNISLIIGLSAVIMPIVVTHELMMRNALFLLIITVVSSIIFIDGTLSPIEGGFMLFLFILYIFILLSEKKMLKPIEMREILHEVRIELRLIGHLFGKKVRVRAGMPWLVIGVFIAVLGAEIVTRGLISVCKEFNISPWLVGVSVIAVGTSLPDITAAYHAARQGMADLALGIGIGANIVSILLNIGMVGLLFSISIEASTLVITNAMRIIITFILIIFMVSEWKVTRIEGVLLMSIYFIYLPLSFLI